MEKILFITKSFGISFLLSVIITPIVIKYANKLGIIDDPKNHKHPKVIHKNPIPRGGAIPIFLAVAISLILSINLDIHLIGILLGGFIIALIGIFDDKYDLNPYLRIFGGLFAASIPVIAGVGVDFISNPLGGIILFDSPLVSGVISVLWIVFLMNVLNMGAKGVDGQLSGVVIFSSITVAALSAYYSADITQWPTMNITIALAGAFLGFLIFHKYPQKIMPGYGGSTLAGYFLAIASILSTTKVGTLIVVLGIPLIDTGYTILRRILSGKSPVWGDTGHLHHRLLRVGFSKNQVANIYWSTTAILGIMALSLNSQYKLYTIIGITLVIGGVLLWLTYRSK